MFFLPFIDCSLLFSSVKMEAQENDLPASVPFTISGFPTIKFKPAGTREFIDYEGDRSYESLVAFLEEHAVNSLEMPEEVPVVAETDEAQVHLETEEIRDEL
jgi:protein disulfide-isomerase A1